MRTSDLARAAGIHPNTVRRYEEWGLLPPVERDARGYRCFTQRHLDCLLLGRFIYSGQFPDKAIHKASTGVIYRAAAGDLDGALEQARRYLAVVQAERAQAEEAATLLERWVKGGADADASQTEGTDADARPERLRIGQAARLVGVTIDVLRNWERDGLTRVPRNPHNGYRLYGAAEIGRLRVIRMLSRAGYSMMALLRMLTQLEREEAADVRAALNTPGPEEDIHRAADRWLAALEKEEVRAGRVIQMVEEIIAKEG
jgi:DNA-binding transcriptional MerR regulator